MSNKKVKAKRGEAGSEGAGASAFRLALTDALRVLDDPALIMTRAAELLARHLGANQAGVGEMDETGQDVTVRNAWTDGSLPSILGTWNLDSFGPEMVRDMRNGTLIAIPDLSQDPRTMSPEIQRGYDGAGIRAMVDLGLRRDGHMVAILFVHHSSPRDWTRKEVALVAEAGERLWAAVERARAERALRASEERMRYALEAVEGIVYDFDLRTRTVLRGGRLREITGFPAGEVPSDADWWSRLVHPDDVAHLQAASRETFAAGRELVQCEYRVRHRDGRWIDVVDRSRIVYEGGEPVRIVGSTIDITARKATERALRDSEASFRTLADAVPNLVWTMDADGATQWFNGRWFSYTGQAPDQALHGGLREAEHPEDAAQIDALWGDARARGEPFEAELRFRRHDGTHRWFVARIEPRRGPDGRIGGWVGTATDIHDRREAALALERSEASVRLRLNTVPTMIWTTDADGGGDFYNDRWYEFIGLPEGATDGEGWSDVIHPEDRDRVWPIWRRALATGEPYEVEYRLRHHAGGHRWVLGRALPLRDEAGAIQSWVGTATDIHDMMEARQALSESRAEIARARDGLEARVAERTAELREAHDRLAAEMARREGVQAALAQSQKLEALGSLTSGVAHDFNNVIAAIAGGFSVIARRTEDPRILDVASHGAEAATRGAALVRQLLSFARQQALEPTSIDLRAMLRDAEPLLLRSVGEKVALRLDLPPDLPPVRADAALLETALINLAVNARDAMPSGGTLTLSARACPPGEAGRPPELDDRDALALSVSDTGTGMSPDVAERALEPFFTTKGPGHGTGLGLAMVHGFARQSGGALRLDTREGAGTKITLFLPGAVAPAIPLAEPEVPPPPVRPADILLVDDDGPVRAVTAAQLSDQGHRVVEASGGPEARAALAQGDFDLVLTDVVMPGEDGVAVAAAARADRPDRPVLFMTGHADHARLEGEAVLDKPFSPAALAHAVAALLPPADEEDLDQLAARLRSDRLRSLLAQWRAARGKGHLPRFGTIELSSLAGPDEVAVIEVDGTGPSLRLREARPPPSGPRSLRALTALGAGSAGEAACRRCAESGRPVHEYARVARREGDADTFERLLLPWSTDGSGVDRLTGVVVLHGPSFQDRAIAS
ncbi:MAG: Signal transduction histidine kinase [uncultured Rubellimicrobium sp.]|uniref:histidine kinase n=1 Tax=uncultured Rubellimicrobium sp. TaxID=543078 RepID=A0A6J4PY07_9RHOB|nr:MAG: Signal transduction histidine kinase [uncultured Rubellimicrobium sp.]